MILLIILLLILLILILFLLSLLLLLLFHFHYITFPYCVLNNNYNKQKYLLIYLFFHIYVFLMFYFLTKFYTSNLGKWNISFLNLSRLFLLFIGVGGINEGLQILLLGIIFQRLHYKNAEFGTKNQVLLFLVVSNRKF